MPRRVETHKDEQIDDFPADFLNKLELPSDLSALLPANLTSSEIAGYLDDIRYALAEYLWELEAGPHRYTRAEAAAALRELLVKGDFRRAALARLNQRAFDLLFIEVRDADTIGRVLGSDIEEPSPELVREAADRAISSLELERGPERSIPRYMLVARLCLVFQSAFNEKITHSNKTRDLAYTAAPQSNGGRFIAEVLSMTMPDISKPQINNALKAFISDRPIAF